MSEWMPIETAPRDGTRVIVFSPYGVHSRAGYQGDCRCQHVCESYWHQPGNPQVEGFWTSPMGQARFRPTHWQPLPAPPTN